MSTQPVSSATWRSTADGWHLLIESNCRARIERDRCRWLCFVFDADGEAMFLGQCTSLADGQAHLFMRFADPHTAMVIADGETPM